MGASAFRRGNGNAQQGMYHGERRELHGVYRVEEAFFVSSYDRFVLIRTETVHSGLDW
jgi:hypothetical protein